MYFIITSGKHTHTHQVRDRGVGLTCSIWQRSEVQSMFSQGWYMPSVTQLRRITMMLILSNHVTTGRRLRSIEAATEEEEEGEEMDVFA